MALLKTVFGRTVLLIGHNNQSICVIIGAQYLAEPGLTVVSDGRCQMSDKILVIHMYQKSLH